jgi:hypothetical protein
VAEMGRRQPVGRHGPDPPPRVVTADRVGHPQTHPDPNLVGLAWCGVHALRGRTLAADTAEISPSFWGRPIRPQCPGRNKIV